MHGLRLSWIFRPRRSLVEEDLMLSAVLCRRLRDFAFIHPLVIEKKLLGRLCLRNLTVCQK